MKEHLLHKDFMGGVLMFIIGTAVSVNSATFDIGTLSQMGSGFFPLVLGLVLTVVGVVLAIEGSTSSQDASEKREKEHSPEWKAWALISIGILSFVVLARFAGLLIATFSIVFISALGDRDNTWRSAALLAVVMVAVSVVVFWWALKIQLPLLAWGNV